MSSLLVKATGGDGDLPLHEALSGIAGSISLVSWIVLLLPQLIENYKNGRADALSMAFLTAWFVGDLTNLIGAIWGGLLPTVIAIAVYFCFADCVLLAQTIYYNRLTSHSKEGRGHHHRHNHRRRSSVGAHNDPTQPLLANRRRRSAHHPRDSISVLLTEDRGRYSVAVKNVLSILGVIFAGVAGWCFAWWAGAWKVSNGEGNAPGKDMPLGAEILGYLSALLYLSARIPQIIRNHQKKSCEGLSLLFFLLSLLGNVTYGAGILLHCTEKAYILDNLPWLLGSLGTMMEDIIIFAQFHIYSNAAGVIEDEENHAHTNGHH
ncbi:vacuolar membrane PQ loop repeat protein [Sphaerosporella brunnea]|uniref:Vacuolar membrane PQ loop repeat protein n=1 Tax=Sphaerosporella brunnea TaxID=1250544 RepID=A0A5J5F2X8_9PEZI|nr:vacuolar membrane PQ loop repeat protein [Sphaerosporella brunnea]